MQSLALWPPDWPESYISTIVIRFESALGSVQLDAELLSELRDARAVFAFYKADTAFVEKIVTVICPLLGGPKSMLFWTRKGQKNAIQETHAGGDYRQAARGRDCSGAGRNDSGRLSSAIDQRANLLPLAQRVWRFEDRSGAADERP